MLVRNTKSAKTIRVMKDYVRYFGVPTRLVTDKGPVLLVNFKTDDGIKHVANAVAPPRATGQVERFNRTVLDALSTSGHGEDDKSWDDQYISYTS